MNKCSNCENTNLELIKITKSDNIIYETYLCNYCNTTSEFTHLE